MDGVDSDGGAIGAGQLSMELNHLIIDGQKPPTGSSEVAIELKRQEACVNGGDRDVQISCFSQVVEDITLHFQIIRLCKQIYAWIGCNPGNFGQLYAAAPTRPNNTVSATSLLGGTSDNIGCGIARRLVLKTGLRIILACNIPKNSPVLEAEAEKMLIDKLRSLGYANPSRGLSSCHKS